MKVTIIKCEGTNNPGMIKALLSGERIIKVCLCIIFAITGP